MRQKRYSVTFFLCLVCFHSPVLRAENFLFNYWVNEPIAASVRFTLQPNNISKGAIGSLTYEQMSIGISLVEIVHPALTVGLFVAEQWQDNMAFGGEILPLYAGNLGKLEVSWLFPTMVRSRFGLQMHYSYARSSERGSSDDRIYARHQVGVVAGGLVYLSDFIALYSGVGMEAESAVLMLETRHRLNYKENIGQLFHLGIDFLVDNQGHIGLESRYGDAFSFQMYLKKQY